MSYMPQTTTHRYIELEPEQDEPDVSGRWTAIVLKLYGVVAVLASMGMVYLVVMAGMIVAARLL